MKKYSKNALSYPCILWYTTPTSRGNVATVVQFGNDDDIINIRYDNVFKAVFTKETEASRKALSSLVSACIDQDVVIESIEANEPPADKPEKQVRFDINYKTADGKYVNVEMSLNLDPFEPVRLEYYSAKLFPSQDIKGGKRIAT